MGLSLIILLGAPPSSHAATRLGLSVGGMTANGETNIFYSLNFEKTLVGIFGFGFSFAKSEDYRTPVNPSDDNRSLIKLIIPFTFRIPATGFRLVLAPGLEYVGGAQSVSTGLMRGGLGYEFTSKILAIRPEVNYDTAGSAWIYLLSVELVL